VICFLIVPSMAAGQAPDRGPRLGGVVSGAFGTGGPAPTVAVTAGYRFTEQFGLEVDASYMGGLDFGEFPVCAPDVLCAARSVPALTVIGGAISLNGRAAMLSVNGVAEVPVRAQWLRPYVVGGVGVAEVRREQRFDSIPVRTTTTSTGPLLTMGGGVDFLLWRKVAVGMDFRYQYVFENDQFFRPDMDRNLTVGRLGTSISYKF
jgi:opacity protein-like surface antigen